MKTLIFINRLTCTCDISCFAWHIFASMTFQEMQPHPQHALQKISCVQMHSCVCSYFTADVAFTSTTYQPLSKKVQKFQEVFLFFFVFSKISRSCYFLSLLLLLILNLKNYRVARKPQQKFSAIQEKPIFYDNKMTPLLL